MEIDDISGAETRSDRTNNISAHTGGSVVQQELTTDRLVQETAYLIKFPITFGFLRSWLGGWLSG